PFAECVGNNVPDTFSSASHTPQGCWDAIYRKLGRLRLRTNGLPKWEGCATIRQGVTHPETRQKMRL
ncbi:hypothetical protein, partial [Bacillus sonorensis]|uniref:hypothetical protein n=1 Tax=Bacillus sonorensis TaxID=119858 RepID=UPI0022DEDF55